MNSLTIKELKRFQDRYYRSCLWSGGGTVLEIGSACVNGSILGRDLWPQPQLYTGADIASGKNVDVIVPDGDFDLGQRFDVVVSSACMEHVKRPWKAFPVLAKHLKPGGHLFFTAPFAFHYHRYPVDCWRFTPDSFQVMCEDSGLEVVEARLANAWPWQEQTFEWVFWNLWQQFYKGIRHIECVGVARKP